MTTRWMWVLEVAMDVSISSKEVYDFDGRVLTFRADFVRTPTPPLCDL